MLCPYIVKLGLEVEVDEQGAALHAVQLDVVVRHVAADHPGHDVVQQHLGARWGSSMHEKACKSNLFFSNMCRRKIKILSHLLEHLRVGHQGLHQLCRQLPEGLVGGSEDSKGPVTGEGLPQPSLDRQVHQLGGAIGLQHLHNVGTWTGNKLEVRAKKLKP